MKTQTPLLALLLLSGLFLGGCNLFKSPAPEAQSMTVSTPPAGEESPDIVVMDDPELEDESAAAAPAPESVAPVKAYWVANPVKTEPAAPVKAAKPAPKHVAAAEAPVVQEAPANAEADTEAMAILEAASEPTAAGPASEPAAAAVQAPFKPKTSSSTGTDLLLVFGVLGLLVAGLVAEPLFRKAIGAS